MTENGGFLVFDSLSSPWPSTVSRMSRQDHPSYQNRLPDDGAVPAPGFPRLFDPGVAAPPTVGDYVERVAGQTADVRRIFIDPEPVGRSSEEDRKFFRSAYTTDQRLAFIWLRAWVSRPLVFRWTSFVKAVRWRKLAHPDNRPDMMWVYLLPWGADLAPQGWR